MQHDLPGHRPGLSGVARQDGVVTLDQLGDRHAAQLVGVRQEGPDGLGVERVGRQLQHDGDAGDRIAGIDGGDGGGQSEPATAGMSYEGPRQFGPVRSQRIVVDGEESPAQPGQPLQQRQVTVGLGIGLIIGQRTGGQVVGQG